MSVTKIRLKKKSAWNKTAKIRSALRQVWRWSPVRAETLRAARVGRGSYLCACCQGLFGPKSVRVDHLETVTPMGWESSEWSVYIDRLFNLPLQVLCLECDKTKQAVERADRAANKKNRGLA